MPRFYELWYREALIVSIKLMLNIVGASFLLANRKDGVSEGGIFANNLICTDAFILREVIILLDHLNCLAFSLR